MTTSLKQITCKYHRNQQENVRKHPGQRSINILTFAFTFIATIGHSIVDRQYLQLGQDQEAVNSPNEAFKWFYAGPDRSQDLLSLLEKRENLLWYQVKAQADHKQQPQDMRGRGPGRWRVRLFTDFWRENLNFPALRIINRRAGGRGAGAGRKRGGGGVL